MKASIILPTKNNQRTIQKCLESIQKQTYTNIEIIFVDNFSDDATYDIAKSFEGKIDISLFQSGPERNKQRPFGEKKASGDILYFIDSDMYLEQGLIQEAIDLLERNDDVGAIIVPEENIIYSGFWTQVKAFERSLYNDDDTTQAARIFKKDVYAELGGYNQSLISGEDWDLSDRVREKYKITRTKSRAFHDEGEVKLWSLLKKKFYYGMKFVNYTNANGIGQASSKIFYFRKSFYTHYKKYLKHPILFLGMFIMLNLTLLFGGLGYIFGKIKK